MTNIKTIEYYNEFAKEFTKTTWGRELDIPLIVNNRRSSLGSFLFGKHSEATRDRHKRIDLVFKNHETHEEPIQTIKHELCHWYCYVSHLDFRDGDLDFEREIKKVGTISTRINDNDMEKSEFFQSLREQGELNKKGFVAMKFKKVDSETIYDIIQNYKTDKATASARLKEITKPYEVIYRGKVIGYVFWFRGSWSNIRESDIQDKYAYDTRKDATYELVYLHENNDKQVA